MFMTVSVFIENYTAIDQNLLHFIIIEKYNKCLKCVTTHNTYKNRMLYLHF